MIETQNLLRNYLAPAKLNLFLHITGRRPNGYHSLQTVFQLVDWYDMLHFRMREDGQIIRKSDIPSIPMEQDLTVRAATLLKVYTGTRKGVQIEIDKHLPIGAGLGGGSSNAATTLLALNQLWRLNLPRADLLSLALKLGTDVPFFIFGKNAFAEGIGEVLNTVELTRRYFLIVMPPIHVSTAAIFSDSALTRNTSPITIKEFVVYRDREVRWPDNFGRNDMQLVVAQKYAEVAQVLRWFDDNIAPARITGSGASVFATFANLAEAEAAQAKLPTSWPNVVTSSLDTHPLFILAA